MDFNRGYLMFLFYLSVIRLCMQSCTMSEHCFCMQTYWRGLEGGQSEWGFEFGFGCNFLLVWV